MGEPLWLSRRICDEIHRDLLLQHGGIPGVRDGNALESALARPQNKLAYQPDSTLFELAAAYGFGLACNHSYVDGKKRVAFMAMYVFLGLNGREIEASEPAVVEIMLAVADGRMSEAALADWVAAHSVEWES